MPIGYYAGLRRDGRKAILLGPYASKAEADANVERARDEAERVDPFCWFDSAGVIEIECAELPVGKLNAHIGLWAIESEAN